MRRSVSPSTPAAARSACLELGRGDDADVRAEDVLGGDETPINVVSRDVVERDHQAAGGGLPARGHPAYSRSVLAVSSYCGGCRCRQRFGSGSATRVAECPDFEVEVFTNLLTGLLRDQRGYTAAVSEV